MTRVTLNAPAKINLALHVGPPRSDGYHPVATLMVALDGLADRVEVAPARTRTVRCPGMDGEANLAWHALDALSEAIGRPVGLDVRIEKRIPSPAGLGGGSSDAAAVLRAARAVLDLDLDDDALERIAARAGSDTPFFIRAGAQWATGRGEVLTPTRVPPFWAVLTRPVGHLPTGAVYRRFDTVVRHPVIHDPSPVHDWRRDPSVRNELWPAALAIAPRLGAMARALSAAGAERVLLCGSGGAMAGLWRDQEGARRGAARMGTAALAVVRSAVDGRRPVDP